MAWKDLAYLSDVGGTPDRSWERYLRSQRYHFTCLTNTTALTTLALTANRLYAMPFLLGSDGHTFIRIAINVTTLTAGSARMGIYTDDGTLYPGSLLVDSGVVDTGTTGMKEVVISNTLNAGLYWVTLVTSAACTVRAAGVANTVPILGLDTSLGTAPGNAWYVAFTFGAQPATFPAGGTINAASVPVVALYKQ